MAHTRDEPLAEEGLHDLGADHGVLAHQQPLLVVERARLEQDAVRHGDLADVMQVRGLFEVEDLLLRPAQLGRQQHGIGGHAGGVTDGVVVLHASAELSAFRLPRCRLFTFS